MIQPLEFRAGAVVTPQGLHKGSSKPHPHSERERRWCCPSSPAWEVAQAEMVAEFSTLGWCQARPPWQICSPNIAHCGCCQSHTHQATGITRQGNVDVASSALGREVHLSCHAASCPLGWFPPINLPSGREEQLSVYCFPLLL